MSRHETRTIARANWASALNVIAGIWLIVSAWLFGFTGQNHVLWNTIVGGILVVIIASCRLAAGPRGAWLSWLNAIVGAWMIASPWIYHYRDNAGAAWNSGLVGALVVVLACIAETPEAARESVPQHF